MVEEPHLQSAPIVTYIIIIFRDGANTVDQFTFISTLQYNPALLDIVYTTAASVYIATYYRNIHSDSPEPS